eukprot:6853585-Pyramimonas_sp.AAC.1
MTRPKKKTSAPQSEQQHGPAYSENRRRISWPHVRHTRSTAKMGGEGSGSCVASYSGHGLALKSHAHA